MPRPTDTLAARFRALEEERARSWPADRRAANRAQRDALLAAFDSATVPAPGAVLPPATFLLPGGDARSLDQLVADGPAVLILFRFAECPADDIALPHYDRALRDAGHPVVAISPQSPERLAAIATRHGLTLTVASDPGNRFARALGLTFTPLDTPEPPPAGWIGEVTGTGDWALPLTSVLVVDPGRVLRWIAVSPDWLDRAEGAAVRAALRPAASAAA